MARHSRRGSRQGPGGGEVRARAKDAAALTSEAAAGLGRGQPELLLLKPKGLLAVSRSGSVRCCPVELFCCRLLLIISGDAQTVA